MASRGDFQLVELDSASQSLSLARITSSFSAPITEEHAFAIIHECLSSLKSLVVNRGSRRKRLLFTVPQGTQDIYLHKEGRVHERTFLGDQDSHRGSLVDHRARSAPDLGAAAGKKGPFKNL